MRSIILSEPGRFVWQEMESAAQPGPGEALVRIRAVGICGTDLHAFRGKQPFFTYPRVLGHELGVEVLAVGPGETALKPGDRCAVNPYLHCGQCGACRRGKTNCCTQLRVLGVHVDGGMRQEIILPVTHLYPSQKLSAAQLALVETLGIGAHAVNRAALEPDDAVLVVGAGPIGLTVMEFLRLQGVRTRVLETSERRRAFAQACHNGLTCHTDSQEVISSELPTAVFDCTGNPAAMMNSFQLVGHGGKLVFVGLFVGDVTFHDPDFHRRETTLLASRNALPSEHRRILQLLEEGAIDTTPWITDQVQAEEMIDAFPRWLDPAAGNVKAIVHW